MQISNNCINLVKRFEGCYLKAYKCPAGVPTIGYGHTNNVKMNDTISQTQADLYLLDDLTKCADHVNKVNDKYNYNFNQNQFDALVSFCFNIGNINQLTGNGTRTKEIISKKMLLYCKAGGRILKGLEKRRKAEQDLYNNPVVNNVQNNVDKKLYKEIAEEVIKGIWGNGNERKQRLTEAGYQYKRVQNLVNEMLK